MPVSVPVPGPVPVGRGRWVGGGRLRAAPARAAPPAWRPAHLLGGRHVSSGAGVVESSVPAARLLTHLSPLGTIPGLPSLPGPPSVPRCGCVPRRPQGGECDGDVMELGERACHSSGRGYRDDQRIAIGLARAHARAPMRPHARTPMRPYARAPVRPYARAPMRPCGHAPVRSCARAPMRPPTRPSSVGAAQLFLCDFASFKPATLPADDPSDFNYFFGTSRRACALAPERFVDSTSADAAANAASEAASGGGSGGGATGGAGGARGLQPSADIFSCG